MANEKRLIDVNANLARLNKEWWMWQEAEQAAIRMFLSKAKTVVAVEVSRLGKLGKLMMPYKGCPRGRMGPSGCDGDKMHITELDPIEDIDGNLWIPVLADDLKELKARVANAVEVVRCKDCKKHRDVPNCEDVICKRYNTFKEPLHFCSYGERKTNEG